MTALMQRVDILAGSRKKTKYIFNPARFQGVKNIGLTQAGGALRFPFGKLNEWRDYIEDSARKILQSKGGLPEGYEVLSLSQAEVDRISNSPTFKFDLFDDDFEIVADGHIKTYKIIIFSSDQKLPSSMTRRAGRKLTARPRRSVVTYRLTDELDEQINSKFAGDNRSLAEIHRELILLGVKKLKRFPSKYGVIEVPRAADGQQSKVYGLRLSDDEMSKLENAKKLMESNQAAVRRLIAIALT
jgi:hypothetical protein